MSTSHSVHLGLILYHTYWLLNCRGHIQMTSNYSTIDVEKENNRVKKVNFTFNTLRTYITLYHTY